jgi:hypothetical protein
VPPPLAFAPPKSLKRSFLGRPKDAAGIVVNKPYVADAANSLKQWHVIAKIGATPVDNQGMVKLDDNLRVFFTYMVQKIAQNGTVPLTVYRAGKEMQLKVPVSPNHPMVTANGDCGSRPVLKNIFKPDWQPKSESTMRNGCLSILQTNAGSFIANTVN